MWNYETVVKLASEEPSGRPRLLLYFYKEVKMDLDNAAAFMLGTMAYGIGILVLVGVVVTINIILHNYWKPVQFFKWADQPATRFMTPEEVERIPPHLNDK